MISFGQVIINATVAGLVSSVAGGLIILLIKNPSRKFIGLTFMFSAAVLLALVFVDLIPHAIGYGHLHEGDEGYYWAVHDAAGFWWALVGMGIGIGIVALLSLFDRHGHEHIHGLTDHSEDCSHDEGNAQAKSKFTARERKKLIVVGLIVAAAIILHDFPKGLAIGASGSILIAIIIGLSCIPEGMTIAVPLKSAGMKWWKILGICALAGLATLFGAVVGWGIGGLDPWLSGMAFAVAAGSILGVVFFEMLPIAFEYAGKTRWTFVAVALGFATVLILNELFHHLAH